MNKEGRALDFEEIAAIINRIKLYFRKKDNNSLEAFQVRLRVISKNYRHLFIYEDDKVSLNKDTYSEHFIIAYSF